MCDAGSGRTADGRRGDDREPQPLEFLDRLVEASLDGLTAAEVEGVAGRVMSAFDDEDR